MHSENANLVLFPTYRTSPPITLPDQTNVQQSRFSATESANATDNAHVMMTNDQTDAHWHGAYSATR